MTFHTFHTAINGTVAHDPKVHPNTRVVIEWVDDDGFPEENQVVAIRIEPGRVVLTSVDSGNAVVR